MAKVEDTLNKTFGARERTEQDEIFEKYADTWARVHFRRWPEESLDSPTYKSELAALSHMLANSNLIEYYNGDRRIKRHLTRDEYYRVNQLRKHSGTGELLNYDQVKCKDNRYGISDLKFEFAYGEEEVKKLLDETEVMF